LKRADLIEDIINKLQEFDYIVFASEYYQQQRKHAAGIIAKELQDLIIIEGIEVI